MRRASSASGSRLRQILTHVKIITQESALRAKDLCGLESDPFSTIAQRMDLAIEPPASPTRTVAPTPPHLLNPTKSGSIHSLGAAQRLGCCQPYLLPIPRSFALSRPSSDCAKHASVSLSNHLLRASWRQNPERLLVLLLQNLFCPVCAVQRRIAHRAGAELKTVVLQHPRRRMSEGVFAPKI